MGRSIQQMFRRAPSRARRVARRRRTRLG